MRRTNITLAIALALAMFASVALRSARTVSAQFNQPVGIVVAYVDGQSITIIDQQGNQSEFSLPPTLKILPPGRADALAVGSFVTVIAPASIDKGKQTAVGIVVHPHIPNGWTIPSFTDTPFATETPSGLETATATGTPATETVTATLTETPPVVETATLTEAATPSPVVFFTDTPTPTATPVGGAENTNTFFAWLRSLLRQVLGNE